MAQERSPTKVRKTYPHSMKRMKNIFCTRISVASTSYVLTTTFFWALRITTFPTDPLKHPILCVNTEQLVVEKKLPKKTYFLFRRGSVMVYTVNIHFALLLPVRPFVHRRQTNEATPMRKPCLASYVHGISSAVVI